MNRAIDQSFVCLTLFRVVSLVLILVPRANAQTGAPPKVSREQVERLVHRPVTTSFAELAAIAPPGLDVIVRAAPSPGQHDVPVHQIRGRIATIASDGLTTAVRGPFGRWRHIPFAVGDIQRVDVVRPSRHSSRTRNIVAGVAGVTAVALMAEHRTGVGLLVLSLPMMASLEPAQFPGPRPRPCPDPQQVDNVPTTMLYVAPDK